MLPLLMCPMKYHLQAAEKKTNKKTPFRSEFVQEKYVPFWFWTSTEHMDSDSNTEILDSSVSPEISAIRACSLLRSVH